MKKAFRDENPVFIPDLHKETWLKVNIQEKDERGRSIFCFPLLVKNKPAGILYLERSHKYGPFSRREMKLIMALSRPLNFLLPEHPQRRAIQGPPLLDSDTGLVGESPQFMNLLRLIEKVKDINASVMIWGESGTGKEMVARVIHEKGTRKKGNFVALNCGAVPDFLLESELFGYVKGAFTGATRNKPGLIEEAEGGAFFLDEIADLSPHLQAKLLRVLQEKEIRRIGENQVRWVNTRFLSATNKNIEEEINKGKFREDLYYRLNILTLRIPPLRERKEDVLVLLNHFVDKYCSLFHWKERPFFSPRAVEMMMDYSWPGNVRELQNEVQRCLIMSKEEGFIKEDHLSSKINPSGQKKCGYAYDFFKAKAEFEKRFLCQALARWNYNKAKTAEKIGLSRQGLFKLIKKHKLNFPSKFSRIPENVSFSGWE
ncbi:sigma-54-dependent Fis family transcriptional regulator [bacterium]|nr:sigma-54-dependent Fis family transcriptional regulator [bacterium]